MASRNHSRRVQSPYGEYPGIGYADDAGGRQEPGAGRQGDGGSDGGPGYMDEMGRVQQFVSDRPHTSLMTAFGVGFGLGLLVTLLLNRQEEESWFERYAPDAIQDLPERFQHARHKAAKVASAMPGSFKQAGETLASYVPSSWKRW
jgi:hypothetical protein